MSLCLPPLSFLIFKIFSGQYKNRHYHSKQNVDSILPVLSAISLPAIVQATTLVEALQSTGASNFATQIQSDPTVAAVFLSSQVQTVFAPIDGSAYPYRRKGKRQTANQGLLYHGIKTANTLGDMSEGTGKPLESNDNTANLHGASHSAVSNSLTVTQSNATKRWVSSPLRRNANTTSAPSLLKIFTGLGDDVSVG